MKLFSQGSSGSLLDGEWSKKAHKNSFPSYQKDDYILFYDKGLWVISYFGKIIAYSCSLGHHPVTIFKGEWFFVSRNQLDQEFYFKINESQFCVDNPCMLEDVGDDYFTRLHRSKILYWKQSYDSKSFHSGAKRKHDALGKRYCWVCKETISANNFVSQHLRMHRRKINQTCVNYLNFLDVCLIYNL